MRKILTSTLMIIIASLVFAGFVLAENTKGTVNVSELNFRESANTSANAIDVLYKGARVNIISEQGDWYKVKYNNEEGYVSKRYITRDNETYSTTNTTNTASNNELENETNTSNNTTTPSNNDINIPIDIDEINITKIKEETIMYVLPLINSTKLEKANANTNVLLISVNGDWAYIQTENRNGWVFKKALEKTTITLGNSNTATNSGDLNNDNTNNTTNETNTTSANTVENTTANEVNTTTEPTATPTTTPTPTPEPTTTSSEYPTTMYVNVEAVNVRSQANTSSTIVTSVGKNVPITVETKEGEWYKVKTSDGNGYIKAEYLSKTK